MKSYKIIIIFIALFEIFSACEKDILDKSPLDSITSVDFFKQSNDLKIYINQFYNDKIFAVKDGLGFGTVGYVNQYKGQSDDYNSDNQIDANAINVRLIGSRTINWGGWDFSDVRSINYFFDNYKKCTSPFNNYKQYLGEAYFFRAMIYFPLLRAYGDLPLITTQLGTDSPELYAARSPRNVVADKIISDLDSAAMYLSDVKDNGCTRVNKWIALTLQSRVALYEGTWEKYHASDAFKASTPLPDKYLNKAIDAATEIMNSSKFDIYSTGKPSSDYSDLFILRTYETNKEVMFWRKWSIALSLANTRNYGMTYPYNKSITKDLADAYLCNNGTPITGNPLFGGYNSLSDEMKNRDPRFYQTIATPDAPWQISASGTKKWSEVYKELNNSTNYNAPAGYICRKGYDPQMIYHDTNYEEDPSILFRYAEVLLNYVEAKAELGTITQIDLDKSIKKLRDRVGMPNLILTNIANDPKWDFKDLSPIVNEIRRERRIELAGEGFRWPDIARWAAADELIVGKRPKGFKASQISSTVFPVDENGFLDPFKNALPNGYGFKIDRDYLDPIPLSQIVLNPMLQQNPGW